MKLITPEQMRRIDRETIEKVGIPGVILMENAAFHISMKASEILAERKGSRVLAAAGCGNNGGDAYAATRHLLSMGYQVSLFSLCPPDELKGDAAVNASILLNMGVDIVPIDGDQPLERFASACREADLVIDGLFGTGLSRDVDGLAQKVIEIINRFSACTLSIDIPSGVDGLTGRICGSAVRADYTVTFFLPKLGMVQYPGAACLGELTVADIGIPYQMADGLPPYELTDKTMVASILPERPEDAHKGSFGKVLIIAGSYGMPGAACLSASAAYRTGSGLVRLAVPHELVPVLAAMLPEAVHAPLNSREGHIAGIDVSVLEGLLESSDAVLVGPGLTCCDDTRELVRQIVSLCNKPLVLDADALNAISGDIGILESLKCKAIITPHPAEMARLTGIDPGSVQSDRIGMAKAFSERYGITVVLKGAGTVIADPAGSIFINPTGNNGMATAGSGDVLAGVILSLLGQGLGTREAAAAGAYLHGLAGDLAAEKKGRAGMIASDMVEELGEPIKSISV